MRLRERFEAIDLTEIESWIGTKQEDLHFDAKLADSVFQKGEEKKVLAKALSGFANSDGGIIAWGVDAPNDTVTGLRPYADADAVVARLNVLTSEAVTPLVEEIEHRAVYKEEKAGYVLTYVPASDLGPHMAQLAENRYYKRNGSSFVLMEHFDIADMFGRRARPVLELDLRPYSRNSGATQGKFFADVSIAVALANKGKGLARFPFLRVRPEKPFTLALYGLDGNGRTGLPMRPQLPIEHESRIFAGGVDDVVHPGTAIEVTVIEKRYPEGTDAPDLIVEYSLSSEGQRAVSDIRRVPGAQLRAIADAAIAGFKGQQP